MIKTTQWAGLAGALVAGLTMAATVSAVTCTWDGTVNDWTNASHWVGGLPVNGATGVITNGTAQINTNLYNAGLGETAPAEIRIASKGTLQFAGGTLNQPSIADHNLVLDGGILGTVNLDWVDIRYDYDVKIRSDSTLAPYLARSDRAGILKLFGALRDYDGAHTGRLTSSNLLGQTWIYSTNNPFSGGWYIPEGVVGAGAPGALGTGDITVTNNGTVGWGISGFDHDAVVMDTNMPNITVWNGGTLAFCGTYSTVAHFSNAPGKTITLKDGSKIATIWGDWLQMSIDAPLYVSGNVTMNYDNQRKWLTFAGDMINAGPATITWNGAHGTDAGYTAITKADNAYTGNWILTTLYPTTYLSVQADGALGTGAVELRSGPPVLDIGKSLKLYNMIYGAGTNGTAGRTLTLQPRYRNATLTDAGVAPGTNWASAVGTLTVPGNLTFTNLVNYDGLGHDAYSKANILLTTDTLGAGTNSMVQVAGNLNGLANADLTVTVASKVPLGTYTILTATNDLSAQRFHSVTFSGGAGRVIYNSNSVQVMTIPGGTVLLVQ